MSLLKIPLKSSGIIHELRSVTTVVICHRPSVATKMSREDSGYRQQGNIIDQPLGISLISYVKLSFSLPIYPTFTFLYEHFLLMFSAYAFPYLCLLFTHSCSLIIKDQERHCIRRHDWYYSESQRSAFPPLISRPTIPILLTDLLCVRWNLDWRRRTVLTVLTRGDPILQLLSRYPILE